MTNGLRALIDSWRARYVQISGIHATMGTGYKVCADELDALLRASASALPEKEYARYSCGCTAPVTEVMWKVCPTHHEGHFAGFILNPPVASALPMITEETDELTRSETRGASLVSGPPHPPSGPIGGPVYDKNTQTVSCPGCKAVLYNVVQAKPRPFHLDDDYEAPCSDFIEGGSQVAPAVYCKTCGFRKQDHGPVTSPSVLSPYDTCSKCGVMNPCRIHPLSPRDVAIEEVAGCVDLGASVKDMLDDLRGPALSPAPPEEEL